MRDAYHYASYGITICAQLTDDHDNGKRRSEEQLLVGPDYRLQKDPKGLPRTMREYHPPMGCGFAWRVPDVPPNSA